VLVLVLLLLLLLLLLRLLLLPLLLLLLPLLQLPILSTPSPPRPQLALLLQARAVAVPAGDRAAALADLPVGTLLLVWHLSLNPVGPPPPERGWSQVGAHCPAPLR
jgi:hypothetical protein